jgi:uncharacterized protein YbaP (TraB family)
MKITLRAALALSAVMTFALGAAAQPVQTVATPQTAHPALWKVSDADTTIYLFGTVHALPPGLTWFDGKVATAFDGSQELVTEIVETEPAQMQALVMSTAVLPRGQSLRAILSPEDKLGVETALHTLGLPAATFDAFEPWYAAIGLATIPLSRQGYATENGVEGTLDARAKALGHPHSALETAEYQLGLFDSLPMDVQKTYLHDVIDGLPTLGEELRNMVAAWSVGDADKLAELMNDEEDDPAMMEKLLINRNRNWAGWIKARLDKPGTVFVAVGAGHLAGAGSVQDQLKDQGISTSRVQ